MGCRVLAHSHAWLPLYWVSLGSSSNPSQSTVMGALALLPWLFAEARAVPAAAAERDSARHQARCGRVQRGGPVMAWKGPPP